MHPQTLSFRAGFFAALFAVLTSIASAQAYKVTNILSDGSVPATTTDPSFINPWAISASPTWWISTEATGFNYVVPPTGTIAFKVIVPAASGATTATGQPAGSVTTAGSVGMILPNGTKASFLFSTLDGTISGWNSKLGTANAISQIAINNSAAGASYTGLALLNTGPAGFLLASNSYLLAANFGPASAIEVYDSSFKPAKLAGSFTDPTLPAGYAPFSVHVIGSQVFVAYALRTATGNVPGNGMVSVFDTAGNFVARVATGGNLNAPWGVAIAPASFGVFSNDLLIGNFGDGHINAFDPKTFAYLGQLPDSTGKSLTYASLWELLPGGTTVAGSTAVSGGDPNTVYFSAGLTNEAHGLFAGIANTTTAGATTTFGMTASTGAATVTAGASTQAAISVAPVNGFSGSVTLACSGLPALATCSFSPASLTVTPTVPALGTVTIQTAKGSVNPSTANLRTRAIGGITAALLLPFASLLAFRRKASQVSGMATLRLLSLVLALVASASLFVGCSTTSPTPSVPVVTPGTPLGQSTVTITATAGSTTQQTTLVLKVQ
jgi:uncharacterized protein (TIGR03118 family)